MFVRNRTIGHQRLGHMERIDVVDRYFRGHVGRERTERKRSRIDDHRAVKRGVERVARTEMDGVALQIIAIIEVAACGEGREEGMAHDRDGVGVEIEVSFAAQQGRVVRFGENQCLRALVVSGRHVRSAETERLRLAVERQDIGGVILGNHAALQAAPQCTAEVPFLDVRDIERLFALQGRYILRMQCPVVLCAVCTYLAQEFEGRVLIRRHHNLRERGSAFAQGDLQTCHRAGFDIKTLGVIADGGEDELGFRLHVHAQDV